MLLLLSMLVLVNWQNLKADKNVLGKIRKVEIVNIENPEEERLGQRTGLMLEVTRITWGEQRVNFIIQNIKRMIYGWRT